jgi:hypothetical protein
MEISEVTIMIVAILACIFSIASTAIGIEAYNKNKDWKTKNEMKFRFLIANLVVAVSVLVLSLAALGFHMSGKAKSF